MVGAVVETVLGPFVLGKGRDTPKPFGPLIVDVLAERTTGDAHFVGHLPGFRPEVILPAAQQPLVELEDVAIQFEEIDERGRQAIVITELPYQVNKARLLERIADLVRQKTIEGISELRDESEEDPAELEASRHDLNYIKLEGTIGNMVNGAGLAMATMDIIKQAGADPANFLDVGGGANAEMVENGFRIILSDSKVKGILINIFGGILRCDILAQGVVQAAKKIKLSVPVVVRMDGTP